MVPAAPVANGRRGQNDFRCGTGCLTFGDGCGSVGAPAAASTREHELQSRAGRRVSNADGAARAPWPISLLDAVIPFAGTHRALRVATGILIRRHGVRGGGLPFSA